MSESLPKGKAKATDQKSLEKLKAEELLLLARRVEREAESDKKRDTLRRILRTFLKRFPDHPATEDVKEELALTTKPKPQPASLNAQAKQQTAASVAVPDDPSERRRKIEAEIKRIAKAESELQAILYAGGQGYHLTFREKVQLHRDLAKRFPKDRRYENFAALADYWEKHDNNKTGIGDPRKGSAIALVKQVLSGATTTAAAPKTQITPNRRAKINDPAGDAKDCLTVSTKGLYGGFENRCNYAVNFHYCAVKPTKDSWLTSYDCHKGQGGSWQVGPLKRAGVHTRGAAAISWFACRKDTHEVYEVHFNPSIGKLQGFCVRTGG